MAPTKGSRDPRSQPQAASPRASEEDESIVADTTDGVPADQDEEVVKLARDMQKSIQRRRLARRQQIENDYHAKMKELENSMNARFTEISKAIAKKHRLRAQALAAKVKKRSLIEQNIFASLTRMEKAYTAISADLQVTLKGRISSLRPEKPDLVHN